MRSRLEKILKEFVVEYDAIAKNDLQERAQALVLIQTALNNLALYNQYEGGKLSLAEAQEEESSG